MVDSDILSFFIITISLLSFIWIMPNFVIWMLIAEILWIGIYTGFIQYAAFYDSISIFIYGLLILCLATSESAIGLTLILFNYSTTGNIHGISITNEWNWSTLTHTLFNKL